MNFWFHWLINMSPLVWPLYKLVQYAHLVLLFYIASVGKVVMFLGDCTSAEANNWP